MGFHSINDGGIDTTKTSGEMILDYSQYLQDEQHTVVRLGKVQEVPPNQPNLFFNKGLCPFCNRPAPQVYETNEESVLFAGSGRGTTQYAWQCDCGWWQIHTHYWDDDTGLAIREKKTRSAILRRFDITDTTIPIDSLQRELTNHPQLLYSLGSRKMEEFVAEVLSDYYDCEVQLVGRSGDGGIDLYLLSGNHVMMVQVKHRKAKSKRQRVEPVNAIREFLGATLLHKGKEAIFVTTSDRFSPAAQREAQKAISLNLVNRFELLDRHDLLKRLNLVQENKSEIWRNHLF